ncbi:MAG TPA: glycosyltransferase family 4 protein [Nitrospira sp.]|nr:glycosyltransferase family 4 protein [Nitrospira sp.]
MLRISLLTGGGDRPYVMGLGRTLIEQGIGLEIIGSNELESPEWRSKPHVQFLNLRGDQNPGANVRVKILRVLKYYAALLRYAWRANPGIFHILWNNKFETVDRTFLMLYYKGLGKRVVLTAHNVNKRKRDGVDSFFNRLTLKTQYRLCDHIFVHTEPMKSELVKEFGCRDSAVTVIPFGINDAVPQTPITTREAKVRLGIRNEERTILFFGRIVPYKGLDYLVTAFQTLLARSPNYRLIIAGRPDNDSKHYCRTIQGQIVEAGISEYVLQRIEFVPDAETEVYFKAADVLVLPYRQIYQSGVLFLAYSFGLPVIATRVGGLPDEIKEGETGYVCRPDSSDDLTVVIERFFEGELYHTLESRRSRIREYARQRYSWQLVGQRTRAVYGALLGPSMAHSELYPAHLKGDPGPDQ